MSKKYRLLEGTHTENGVTYKAFRGSPPQIVDSEFDLIEQFPHKFVEAETVESVRGPLPDPVRSLLESKEGKTSKEELESASKAEVNPIVASGENVTEEFPNAAESGLLVFAYRGHYCVVLDDEAKTCVAEDVTSKAKVKAAIAEYEGSDKKGG